MPCFTVRTVSLKLGVANFDLLERSLRAAGYQVYKQGAKTFSIVAPDGTRATIDGDEIIVRQGSESIVNEVKRTYSTYAVKTAAKKYGWVLTQNRTNAQRFQARRR